MGHVRSYTIADVCARRARSQGDSVLWAMGFDAFGLPNEIAALEKSIPPKEWVASCVATMKEQFDRLGLSVDWSRCFVTSDPEYYRWTQWIFLRFFEKKLVHRAQGIENWCDRCKVVLATMQVTDNNRCWRCDGPVSLARVHQWYLRFLPYAEELERGISELKGWDDAVVTSQRTLLGKTEGVAFEVEFPYFGPLEVFTPYPAAICNAKFIALSPNHPCVEKLVSTGSVNLNLASQRRRALKREERSDSNITVIESGCVVNIPGLPQKLPIVITPSVDTRFGGGAALGIPSHDQTDSALALQLGLEPVYQTTEKPELNLRPALRYRLRDSSISRQRSWGAPVPIIHCENCGTVPVPDKELPVQLPPDLIPLPEGSALAKHPSFSDCNCPSCGAPAKRDTDTLDVHIDSIWMLIPFCVPTNCRAQEMFTHSELRRWLPVSQVVCGIDQAAWWINDRLCFKVLHDCGYFGDIPDREPVRNILMHEMVLANGRKMSKSLGNAVDPQDIINRYGADALRLTVLRVNPRKAFSWTEEAVQENSAFLAELWSFFQAVFTLTNHRNTAETYLKVDSHHRKLARWCATAVAKTTKAYEENAFHVVLKELKIFFAMCKRFAFRKGEIANLNCRDLEALKSAMKSFLFLFEPLAPHISYELKEIAEVFQQTAKPSNLIPGEEHESELTLTLSSVQG